MRNKLKKSFRGNDEITQIAKNINAMSSQLENKFIRERQLEQARNDLIANVSHALRKPLTSMIGYLNLIKDRQYKDTE